MSLRSSTRHVPRLSLTVTVGICCLVVTGLTGCPSSSDQKTGSTNNATQKAEEKNVASVSSALAALHPTEFEIGVPRDLPSTELNSWAEVMLSDLIDPEVEDGKLKEALKPYLDDAAIERVVRRTFVPRDSVAIRDAIWARLMAESVAKTTDSDVERVVRLFRVVTQNLHVLPSDGVPLGLFDRLQLGFGQPEARAWAFGLLAQQLKLPSVIVEPQLPAELKGSESVIVGVLIDSQIYLFDMSVGLPIPAKDDGPKQLQVEKVATLSQVLADDSLLRALDTDGSPYAYQTEHFKNSKLFVMGDSGFWSRRFEGLQNGMAKESTAVIFQPLVSIGPFEGLLNQIVAAVKDQIPQENVAVWKYAEEHREKREALNDEQLKGLKELFEPFQAPRPLIIKPVAAPENGKAGVELDFGKGWNHLLVARTKQLVGQTSESIPMYLKLQGWARLPPVPAKSYAVPPEAEAEVAQRIPEEIQRLHGEAAELALFWRATCQLENGEYGTAASDFETYVTRVARGTFPTQARYLAGLATALNGNPSRGSAFLSRIDKSDSQYRAARFLMKRWKALADEGASEN